MPRLRLTLEYDGSRFLGWQAQTGGGTVQDELERALEALTGESIRVAGSGRTDAGVHAVAQVASFDTRSAIPPEKFPMALNSHLPDGISVLACEAVGSDFHARYSAKAKTYRYVILNRASRPALDLTRATWVSEALDVEAMGRAGRHFIGRHDFRAFATGPEDEDADFVREVFCCEVVRESAGGDAAAGDRITITVEGTGFLRKMVRTIAGTLIDVGRGKTPAAEIPRMIASRDRTFAGPTAPPQGLYLVEVKY